MYLPYPKNVGILIENKSFDHRKLRKLKKKLPKNLILRFYGLAGVGKGTVSKNLSQTLKIPYLEASFILRTVTFVFEHFNYEIKEKEVIQVFQKIHVKLENNGEINFYFLDKKIKRDELKNSQIDEKITTYSSHPLIRAYYNHFLDQLLEFGFDQPIILDSRGAMPPYLEKAAKRGQDIIQFLVIANEEAIYERYKQEKIRQIKILNPSIEDREINKIEILKQYKNDIKSRNDADIEMMLKNKMGIISADSFLLDTSFITPKEAVNSILHNLEKIYLSPQNRGFLHKIKGKFRKNKGAEK